MKLDFCLKWKDFLVDKMLRLAIFLFLCVAAHGKELECNKVVDTVECWNSETEQSDPCLICEISNQQISESDEVIFIIKNHTADVKVVHLKGGDVNKLPNFIQKSNKKEITEVKLIGTKTPVLNSQFFGSAGENLTKFECEKNENLKVEALAFQNCKNLEHLELNYNKGSLIIAPDAFRKLHKLIELNLGQNDLSLVLNDWFDDLGNLEELFLHENQLTNIPDNAFKSLIKLKKLYLSGNKIELITKNMFQQNEKLQEIYFSRNNIKEIQSRSFKHLSELTELNLGKNECVDRLFYHKTSEEIAEKLTACYPKTFCVIPQIKNGIIVSIDDNSTQFPGDSFETSGPVKVVCNATYTQFHHNANQATNRCVEGNWEDPQWPICESELLFFSFSEFSNNIFLPGYCPREEIIDPSFFAYCDYYGADCSNYLLPGAIATIRCQRGFMNPKGLVNLELICEESGNWSQSAQKCEPIEENVTEPSSVQSEGFLSTLSISCKTNLVFPQFHVLTKKSMTSALILTAISLMQTFPALATCHLALRSFSDVISVTRSR